jgi:two-component system, chemotaxis family, chemotaxis protein CheY
MQKRRDMKTLIVEDDFTSRIILQEILRKYGVTHIAVNGREAVEAVRNSLERREHYDLICMDIMMPEMDGQTSLKKIRELEEAKGIFSTYGAKILMTTILEDAKNVIDAFKELCDGYLIKPIDKSNLLGYLQTWGLIPK